MTMQYFDLSQPTPTPDELLTKTLEAIQHIQILLPGKVTKFGHILGYGMLFIDTGQSSYIVVLTQNGELKLIKSQPRTNTYRCRDITAQQFIHLTMQAYNSDMEVVTDHVIEALYSTSSKSSELHMVGLLTALFGRKIPRRGAVQA